ncbi:MAG: formylmethanofuran dehydrogenase [Burkholderiaceae bacterium]
MRSVRALQDRGGFTTTLAEVRNRADLIVCVGGLPSGPRADFFRRCGLGETTVAQRHVVVLGGSANDEAALAALAGRGVTTESVPMQGGDLFSTAALLAALLADREVGAAPPQLATLAERLRNARYSVFVAETSRLPTHAGLLIETVDRIVATLNIATRSAALWLGGGNGADTVNQVFTWLSGLPLRSRAGPAGLEHEPLCFDAQRLLDDAAVDSLLWVSSFDPGCVPPPTDMPMVVLGHPGLAAATGRPRTVFIPVSTPGIGSAGHLFRGDGGAVLPLVSLYRDSLPELADVLTSLTQAVKALRAEASA